MALKGVSSCIQSRWPQQPYSLKAASLKEVLVGEWWARLHFKDKGEMAPVEYSTPVIKDMIVSVRKQELILSLEQNLLEDARLNGKYKTY